MVNSPSGEHSADHVAVIVEIDKVMDVRVESVALEETPLA